MEQEKNLINVVTLERYFAKCNEVVSGEVAHLKELYTQSEKFHAESMTLALEKSRLETEKIKIESNGYKERFDARLALLEDTKNKQEGGSTIIYYVIGFCATIISGTSIAILVKLFTK
jgi:hypothetical protein